MLDGMTNIKASEVLKELKFYTEDLPPYSPDEVAEALEMAIKALEMQYKPIEKFDNVKQHIDRLAGDYKCWDCRLTHEEALELSRLLETHEGDLIDQILDKLTEVYERHGFLHYADYSYLFDFVDAIPSGTPQPKVGRWDFTGNQMFQCTSCGEPYTQDQLESLRNYTYEPQFPKYCPSCGSYNGAKMEVEDADSD